MLAVGSRRLNSTYLILPRSLVIPCTCYSYCPETIRSSAEVHGVSYCTDWVRDLLFLCLMSQSI